MEIDIINITKEKNRYKELINYFIESLHEEKQYFKLDKKRFAEFKLTIAAFSDGKIVGLAGFERKVVFLRSLIMVKKEYQGIGLGKYLYQKLMDEARKEHYSIILGATSENNYKAQKLHYSVGYKYAGKKDNLIYFINPLNLKGQIIYYLIRIVFPVLRMVEYFRR